MRKNSIKKTCAFCNIINKNEDAHIVYEDDISLAFLDIRPIFYGHTLIVPKKHIETIYDLEDSISKKFISNIKYVGKAVEIATKSEGTLIIVNNVVSQSVPHLHMHIIPRKFGDGLRGFMWPRKLYESEEHISLVLENIKKELEKSDPYS